MIVLHIDAEQGYTSIIVWIVLGVAFLGLDTRMCGVMSYETIISRIYKVLIMAAVAVAIAIAILIFCHSLLTMLMKII